jgi:hypothetical protein
LAPIEPGDSGWPARKERLLERVHARGQAIHRRRQVIRGLSAATAVLLLAAVPGALATSGGSGRKSVRTIGGPSTSTSEETTTSLTPTTTTAPLATTTTVPPSTTTTLVCRNSTNPACGAFRWDPPPAPDQPLTRTVTYSPAHPRVGEQVTFHFVFLDPDDSRAREWQRSGKIEFGDSTLNYDGLPPDCPPRYGRWTPPAAAPGRWEADFQHIYTRPGTFTVSGAGDYVGACYDPYASAESPWSVSITVDPAPTTTTTAAP